jgi:hypothetical protein
MRQLLLRGRGRSRSSRGGLRRCGMGRSLALFFTRRGRLRRRSGLGGLGFGRLTGRCRGCRGSGLGCRGGCGLHARLRLWLWGRCSGLRLRFRVGCRRRLGFGLPRRSGRSRRLAHWGAYQRHPGLAVSLPLPVLPRDLAPCLSGAHGGDLSERRDAQGAADFQGRVEIARRGESRRVCPQQGEHDLVPCRPMAWANLACDTPQVVATADRPIAVLRMSGKS